MKTLFALTLFGFSTALILSSSNTASANSAVNWKNSQHLWQSTCFYCHEETTNGPSLFSRDLPLAVINNWMREGHGAMPPFRPAEVSDKEIEALSQWINEQPATAR